MKNNSSQDFMNWLLDAFKKIISDATTRTFLKMGGVSQPLIFHQ